MGKQRKLNRRLKDVSQSTPIGKRLPNNGHVFSTEGITILDHDARWLHRGVKEVITWRLPNLPSVETKGDTDIRTSLSLSTTKKLVSAGVFLDDFNCLLIHFSSRLLPMTQNRVACIVFRNGVLCCCMQRTDVSKAKVINVCPSTVRSHRVIAVLNAPIGLNLTIALN